MAFADFIKHDLESRSSDLSCCLARLPEFQIQRPELHNWRLRTGGYFDGVYVIIQIHMIRRKDHMIRRKETIDWLLNSDTTRHDQSQNLDHSHVQSHCFRNPQLTTTLLCIEGAGPLPCLLRILVEVGLAHAAARGAPHRHLRRVLLLLLLQVLLLGELGFAAEGCTVSHQRLDDLLPREALPAVETRCLTGQKKGSTNRGHCAFR